MNIVIARDDQTFGPYSRDQVTNLLEQGDLSPEYLATWEGREDWRSLNDLLTSSSESEHTNSLEEDDNEDDFDHEKMKQWEDMFVDDEDEFEDDEQFVDDTANEEAESSLLFAQSSVPPPPEIVEEQVVDPSVVPPVEAHSAENSFHEDQPAPPPPPPPPSSTPPARTPASSESRLKTRENENSSRPSSITPRSKKIKGLNNRQTVIVVKGAGLFSKLYTISLVFLILAVISYLVAFVLVALLPEEVGPKLQQLGVSLEWFGHEAGSEASPSPPSEPSSSAPSSPSDSGGGTKNSETE